MMASGSVRRHPGTIAGPTRHRISPFRWAALLGVNLLLVVSVVPWRSDVLFEGGIDAVVVGKALVALAALAGSAGIALTTRSLVPVGLGPGFLVLIVLLISALGALVEGEPMATVVLVVRIVIIIVTVVLLLSAVPWSSAVGSLFAAMATVALVAAATGLPDLLANGRLGGGVPEIHPNGLAGLAGTPLIALVALMLHRGPRPWIVLGSGALFAIVVATGSRTGLLAVVIALLVVVGVNGIHDRRIVYVLLACIPIVYFIATFTEIFSVLVTRAGSTDTTSSLESRMDAWTAVLAWSWTTWQKWIGLGIATKTVEVDKVWRDTQVLDSSWVSVLAQAGILGMLLMAALVAWCVIAAMTSSRRRWLVLPVLVLVLLRSITESGLLDSAEPFVVLMVLAGTLTRRNRHGSVQPRASDAADVRALTPAVTYDDPPPGRHRRERSAGEP